MGKFKEIIAKREPDTERKRYRHFFFFFRWFDPSRRIHQSSGTRNWNFAFVPLFVLFFQTCHSDVLLRRTLLPGFSRGSPPSGTRSNEKIYKSSSRNRDLNVSKCSLGEVRNNPRTLLEKISSSGRMTSSVSGAQLRQG